MGHPRYITAQEIHALATCQRACHPPVRRRVARAVRRRVIGIAGREVVPSQEAVARRGRRQPPHVVEGQESARVYHDRAEGFRL